MSKVYPVENSHCKQYNLQRFPQASTGFPQVVPPPPCIIKEFQFPPPQKIEERRKSFQSFTIFKFNSTSKENSGGVCSALASSPQIAKKEYGPISQNPCLFKNFFRYFLSIKNNLVAFPANPFVLIQAVADFKSRFKSRNSATAATGTSVICIQFYRPIIKRMFLHDARNFT